MARLQAQKKMGYYPTPLDTLEHIKDKLRLDNDSVILDPCCGKGSALYSISIAKSNKDYDRDIAITTKTYGIELDNERADTASIKLNNILYGSIYETIVRPIDSFSMLYLNPPYEWESGDRMEFLFLKQSHKWLTSGGALIYIVPEHILTLPKISHWIARRYENIRIYRFTKEDYPKFKQVVMFAYKRKVEVDVGAFPAQPFQHIEDSSDDYVYKVIASPYNGMGPQVFELKGVTPEEVLSYKDIAAKNIMETLYSTVQQEKSKVLSPLLPLRKGHLVSLLMSGVLNGELDENGKQLVFKCFTERQQSTRLEGDGDSAKEIILDTYMSGIRVIEKGRWYDVK